MSIVNSAMDQLQEFVERETRKQAAKQLMYGELEDLEHFDPLEHDGSVDYEIEAWGE